MATKVDLKKELSELYRPSAKEVSLVDVPPMNFLMIDGQGDPNTSKDFQDAVEALYGLSYTLKFMLKKTAPEHDYTVMPLEGLWWTEGQEGFDVENKGAWQWTLMIMQPEHITGEHVMEAAAQLKEKKDPHLLDRVRFERFDEGPTLQIMYIGPYAEEGPTIEKLHQYAREHGYSLAGKHHEIYLGDPRRTAPEKLKTIIRHPVK